MSFLILAIPFYIILILLKNNLTATQPDTSVYIADSREALTLPQIRLVQNSWHRIAPFKLKIAELFYNRLFELDSDIQLLFKDDMEAQGGKLMRVLTFIVNSLNDFDEVVPTLQELGRNHVEYGVKSEYYENEGVIQLFLWAAEHCSGSRFTDETEKAWLAVYSNIADIMKNAAEAKENG